MSIDELRSEFPITERYAFFNHAGVSALNRRSATAMAEFGAISGAQPIDTLRHQIFPKLEDLRIRIAQLISAESTDEIVAMPNTATAINTAALSLPLQPGDNVLVVDGDYPANVYPWWNLAYRGVLTKIVPARHGAVDLPTLQARIDRRTRVIALSAVMFASGARTDLAAVGQICKERGIFFVVDAIQALGGLPIDVQAWHIDMLGCGSQKWLLGPMGTGFLYVRKSLLDRLQPGAYVGTSSVVDPFNFLDYNLTLQPTADRFSLGTPNVIGMLGLRESIALIQEAGVEQVAARILYLADILHEELNKLGLRVSPVGDAEQRSGIVIAEVAEPEKVYQQLLQHNVITAPRGAGVRFAPHFYNNEADIERGMAALKSVLG